MRWWSWIWGATALEGAFSIIGLDSALGKTFHWIDSSSYRHTGSVHLPGDQFLRRSQLPGNGNDTAYYFDVQTGATTAAPLIGHDIFDLTNSSFISRSINDQLVLYDKTSQQKVDSVDVPAVVGYQPDYF
ncbi:MAG: hypothetical protein U5L96_14010 [Owenweeksia sp.]|nr:hypothetical protein [Owenweeksia sp.]